MKRPIVTPSKAPLIDAESKAETVPTATFNLPVNNIPDEVQTNFLKLKQKWKAKGITKLKNGDKISLSGYMKQCVQEGIKRDIGEL